MNIKEARKTIDRYASRFEEAKVMVKQLKKKNSEVTQELEQAQTAQAVIQKASAAIQHEVHQQIASIVSSCLATVFEDPYSFKINFREVRGKTEAEFKLVRNGKELNPLDATGGGVVDVTAFALRLACLVLSTPKRRKLLILDEPFKNLSAEYIPIARELILKLAEQLNVQFLIVTHIQDLMLGKVVQL